MQDSTVENITQFVRKDIPGRFNELAAINRHYLRYVAYKKGFIVPPYEVLIHPSSICNLACAWCIGEFVPLQENATMNVIPISTKHEDNGRLSDALAVSGNMERLVNDILSYKKSVQLFSDKTKTDFKIENISFSGLIGEPLVAKESVVYAMDKLSADNRRVGIFTNGLLIDDRVLESLLKIAYVHISVDAGTSKTYSQLKARTSSQKGQYDKVMDVISKLAYRKSADASQLEINCSYIMYPENYAELYECAKRIKNAGCEIFRVKQDNSGERLLSPEQSEEAGDLIKRIKSDLVDENFRIVEIQKIGMNSAPVRNFSTCRITELMAAIGSDGKMYPCNYHPRPNGYHYGSVIDESFRDVWEGKVRQSKKGKLPEVCPKVCDPFKGRANNMLQHVDKAIDDIGVTEFKVKLEDLVQENIDA